MVSSIILHFLNLKDKQDTFELISVMDLGNDFRISDLMFFLPAPDTGLIGYEHAYKHLVLRDLTLMFHLIINL